MVWGHLYNSGCDGVVLASLQKKDETANSTHLAILLKLSKMIIEKVTLNNIKL